jgi:hypothetical protein
MKTKQSVTNSIMAALGLLSTLLPVSQTAHAQGDLADSFVAPTVFQAAGPNAASIQSTVDAFRAALGDPNNGNNPGPLATGRREINWDGGDPNIMDTTPPVTPFDVFLNTRGAHFTTPGLGLSQAPPSGGTQGGLAVLFNNPTYGTIFTTFSPSRLFTPVGSNVTDGSFFVPGTTGASPATVSGFGAVFTDVDQPDGGGRRQRAGTTIACPKCKKPIQSPPPLPTPTGRLHSFACPRCTKIFPAGTGATAQSRHCCGTPFTSASRLGTNAAAADSLNTSAVRFAPLHAKGVKQCWGGHVRPMITSKRLSRSLNRSSRQAFGARFKLRSTAPAKSIEPFRGVLPKRMNCGLNRF